jgi:hypothetical protein
VSPTSITRPALITDHQEYLRQVGFRLPLTEVWQADHSAFMCIKTGHHSGNWYTVHVGNGLGERFLASAKEIPHKYWISYYTQKGKPVGVIFSPRCSDGIPLAPFGRVLYSTKNVRLQMSVKTQIIFESMRMQLGQGCGLVCPWYGVELEGKNRSCCGWDAFLWAVYYHGQTAIDKARWHPDKWDPPECTPPP